MLRQKSIGMSPEGRVSGLPAGEGGAWEGDRSKQEQGDLEMPLSASLCDHGSVKLGKELRLCCWANLALNPVSYPSQLCDLGQVALLLWA